MFSFFVALFLTCACTLMYEIVLTRLLSAVCWYYLAFVSVSMAMFGMTAGALAVQLRSDFFSHSQVPRRLTQASFAMALSMPLVLLNMLAVPIDISFAAETLYSFCLFAAIISVPFFFSGVVVCLALTKSPFPIGRVYFADLLGAAVGCLSSVALLKLVDAPSAVFVISALLALGTAAYATYGRDPQYRRRSAIFAAALAAAAGLNALTSHGIQPIWAKGQIDRRLHVLAEVWTPISKVRAWTPAVGSPVMWGPSPRLPSLAVEYINLEIDNAAGTEMLHYQGDLSRFGYLRYDVTSLAAQLRPGGTAAIIGVGGGRDVLNCALNNFWRIVGIEVNGAIVELTSRRFDDFSGFSKIPGFELHNDEARSYLTRSGEKFDLIQASMVDTWAAASAGALTLTENALYTVEAWRIFFEHLKPHGLLTFSRWDRGAWGVETSRLFALAWATLLSEGVNDPGSHMALVGTPEVATLIASSSPLSASDMREIRAIANEMEFHILFLPGEPTAVPELRTVAAARTLHDLEHLTNAMLLDYSAVFDSSPYFFNAVRVGNLPRLLLRRAPGGHLMPLAFVFSFMLAAVVLVGITILLPVRRWLSAVRVVVRPPAGGPVYFIGVGLGFMLVEMGMMQQLSVFLGHPVYSLVVVLAGLILATGIGSLVSDRIEMKSSLLSRTPAFAAGLIVLLYSATVLSVIHHYVGGQLLQRVMLSLALVLPCGFLMGFCFPVGLRWMSALQQESTLPWMWALNGAASTLGSFVAVVISMNTTITDCILCAAACYILAGIALPAGERAPVLADQTVASRERS